MDARLQFLHEMLSEDCEAISSAQHSHVLLRETDPLAALKAVTIQGCTGEWLAFSPDRGRGRAAIFSPLLRQAPSLHHHRACDGVLLRVTADVLSILYMDLKSTNPTGFRDQFRSTRQFLSYLLGLHDTFSPHPPLGSLPREEWYTIFYTGPNGRLPTMMKAPIAPKSRPSQDAEQPLKLLIPTGGTVYLRQLLPLE